MLSDTRNAQTCGQIKVLKLPVRMLLVVLVTLASWYSPVFGQCTYSIDIFAYNGTSCSNEILFIQTDAPTPQVQWYRNDTLLPGEEYDYLYVTSLGDYKVSMVDFNSGCTDTSDVFSITNDDLPEISINGDTTFCAEAQLIAVADTGFEVTEWFHPELGILESLEDTIYVSAPGTYELFMESASEECFGFSTITISQIPNTLPEPMVYQNGDTLSTDSAYAYQWLRNQYPIPGATSQEYVVTDGGYYSVMITDSICMYTRTSFAVQVGCDNGCSCELEIFSVLDEGCIGTPLSVTYDGSYQDPMFQWYRNDTLLPGENQQDLLDPTEIGDYYVVVTSNTPMCADTSNPFSVIHEALEVTITGDTLFCEGNATTLSLSANMPLEFNTWYYDLNEFGFDQDSVEVTASGVYKSECISTAGCYAEAFYTVMALADTLSIPVITASGDTLSTATGYTYQWYLDFAPIAGAESSFYVPEADGIYQVQISNDVGCTSLSNGYVVGSGQFTYPADVPFMPCGDPINLASTGAPEYSAGLGSVAFKDTYYKDGMVVYTDSDFKRAGYDIGDYLPEFSAPDQNGETQDLYIDASKPTIIDFCTFWCTACQNYIAEHNTWKLYLESIGTPINYTIVITQNPDGNTSTQNYAVQWANTFEISDPILWGSSTLELADSAGITAYPTFVIIGIDGEVIGTFEGADKPAMETALADYYSNHPLLCQDSIDYIQREWRWLYQGNVIDLPNHQVLNFAGSCNDGVQNGDETGIDCGTAECGPCNDADGDGVPDNADNCPNTPNPVQSDENGNGIGDLCDSLTLEIDGVGIGTTDPKDALQLETGNLYVNSPAAGVVLKSPDGKCWKLTVANNGSVTAQQIDCRN